MREIQRLSDSDLIDLYDEVARERPFDQLASDERDSALEKIHAELVRRDLSW